MQSIENNKNLILAGANRLGVELSRDQVEQFLCYLETLQRWNTKINLTSIREDPGIIIRHFLDSLAGLAVLPAKSSSPNRVLDAGAGAGFPGLPIKICRPDIQLTLVESKKKKAAFLHSLCGQLGIQGVEILSQRIEEISQKSPYQGAYDILLSRALKPSEFLNQARSLLRPGGRAVLWTAKRGEEIIEQIKGLPGWGQPKVNSYRLPLEDIERSLVILQKEE